ncbi:MAG: alpha/beta hydrolase [Acidimicrobiales bacterium]
MTAVLAGPDHLRVDIRNQGSGAQPLVLLPGIGASLDLYEGFRTAFGRRETVGIDPPGVGGSAVPRRPMTMAATPMPA